MLQAPLRAALIWGAVERLIKEIGVPLSAEGQVHYNRLVSSARRATHNDATFDSAWQQGRNTTLEQVIAYALEPDRET